jgi:hypothetical protein
VLLGHHHCNKETRKRSISESYSEHPLQNVEFQSSISLHDEIRQLRDTIKTRDDEIDKLKSEIHKLKVSESFTRTILKHFDDVFHDELLWFIHYFIIFFRAVGLYVDFDTK